MNQTTPQSYYGGDKELWTCIFPGKFGISWKLAWTTGTRVEAEAEAIKHSNVVAVPLALWLRYKEYEHRTVFAERKLLEELDIRVDYDGAEPRCIQIKPIANVNALKVLVSDFLEKHESGTLEQISQYLSERGHRMVDADMFVEWLENTFPGCFQCQKPVIDQPQK